MLKEFIQLIYPDFCSGCNQPLLFSERAVCSSCLIEVKCSFASDSNTFFGRYSVNREIYAFKFFTYKVNSKVTCHISPVILSIEKLLGMFAMFFASNEVLTADIYKNLRLYNKFISIFFPKLLILLVMFTISSCTTLKAQKLDTPAPPYRDGIS